METEKGERYHDDMESTDALLGDERQRQAPTLGRLNGWTISIIGNILLFLLSLSMLVVSLSHRPSVQEALKRTTIYSPVLDDTEMRLDSTSFNGTLLPGPNPSPWRKLPSDPVAEEAWDSFEHIRTVRLTKEQIVKMGKNPETIAKYEDAVWHMGDDAYVGALDFFHQVHCLNMLRKAAFQGNSGLAGNKKMETIHLQHCTDMLMQHLLCNADPGMITYGWVEDNDHPFPDFGVQKQCWDWRQLVEWRDEHAVDLETYLAWTKPEGIVGRKWQKEYWELIKELDEDDKAEE